MVDPTPFYVALGSKDAGKRERIRGVVDDVFNLFSRAVEDYTAGERGVTIPRRFFGPEFDDGPYGSIDWYIQRAWNGDRGQADASVVFDLCKEEPWQRPEEGGRPHYELMIVDEDLYVRDCNFIFGITRMLIDWNGAVDNTTHYPDGTPRIFGIVLSTARMNNDDELFAMLTHELGHFYGMPSHREIINDRIAKLNPNFIDSGDPRARCDLEYNHCDSRDCIMEQVNVGGRLYLPDKIAHLRDHNPDFFCDFDWHALGKNLAGLYLR